MSFDLARRGNAYHVRFAQSVDAWEVVNAAVDVESDQCFSTLSYVLYDFRPSQVVNMDVEAVDLMSTLDWEAGLTNRHLRIAVVPVRGDVEAFFAEYLRRGRCNWRLRIFATIVEAQAWVSE